MAHDVMAQKYSRMKTYLRPWAVLSERRMLKQGTVFTFSEKDCVLIKELYGIQSYSTTFFLSPDVQAAFPEACNDYYVFFGGWVREENFESIEWFVDYPVLPKLQYKIIGGGLPQRIKDKLPTNFEYLGFVDNPYPIIANAKAEIAPLRKGAGVKVKCIDSMGCGTPVIGTDVAFEGIPTEFCEFMIHAETVNDYVEAIEHLNFSIEERVNFKQYFTEKYNRKTILDYIEGKGIKEL
jgi:glycosyltransferase involved in cell wall biosynthesis